MTGADRLLQTARASGVDVCFANPGTTEMPLVAALDRTPEIRAVLGLFEGVCTGAADGYARMAGRPALALLHLGPGFANGIANLHNARRAGTPMLVVVGDHATWHAAADAPLASDIVSLANPVSGWVRSVRRAEDVAADTAAALEAAGSPPGQVATLIVPADCQWETADGAPVPVRASRPSAVSGERIDAAVRALRAGDAALLVGGPALGARGLRAAARIRAACGARLLHDAFVARLEHGAQVPELERIPYFPEQAAQALGGLRTLLLAGTRDPVAFFGYPGGRSRIAPDTCARLGLAAPHEDAVGALEALADALGAPAAVAIPERARPSPPSGTLDVATLGQALAALQPENAIVVDEGLTSSAAWFAASAASAPHTVLGLTGGAIGQGLPCAVGAALACPDRRVIALQADGSGLFTLQALWTMAREQLDVVTIVCANRSYRILQVEAARAGIAAPGPATRALSDLTRPELDWTTLATGLGVPAVRVDRAEALVAALSRALATPGPTLVEALL
ncbi:acetolactate synthase large subunit [Myxococcota bacterium]|nr:acetolactate synthase large subunit [Myxococcota bacterium]MCZ7619612.1 acetolactate synthase large subunit [Myxococcota bacterium]